MGRIFTQEELKDVLEKHQHWVLEDCDGWESMRADLCEAILSGADLREADLCEAILYGANLREANLSGANLSGADLCEAILSGADLREADLRRTNLYGANLREANLSGANLSGADLYGADLCEADLCRTNLYGANLREAKNVPFIPIACPDTGSFTGWKKAMRHIDGLSNVEKVIIELEIPTEARRSSATTRKCRCDRAFVKSITSIDGTKSFDTACSMRDYTFIYEVGKEASVDNFDEDRFNECAPGIHFFINRQEAVDYQKVIFFRR